ncbi:MAG TPA: hypothetical protein VGS97_25035 [Actinocrinis sp.]|uniref:hypothetical protein n=1 Tax=Actinocrinis sp. TaxID=1920516 RepID=UPI002DDD6858|nr:hypothetical protein [Actinocrinis sp.]HEV2347384.1 hypothetical protein [Actinocrinis sp.]
MPAKTPNAHLADHLAEAGISRGGLAHRINTLAVRRGLPAPRFNHASVARWLRGEQPRGRTPDLIAEVLSVPLGRTVTRADIGMRSALPVADLGLSFESDLNTAVVAASDLYATDAHRRATLTRSAYTSVGFVVPAIRWMTAPAADLMDRAGSRRVGGANIIAIREVTSTFRRLDNMFGGGYARSTVVQYLADEVSPLLRHGAYTADVGRELFSAAAEMTLLAGWMAFDLEQHPIAQRYLIQALRLAQAGGDVALGAETLAAMSCQAGYLGEGADAVDMARAAHRSARRSGSAALMAETLVTEAHGHALTGDQRACAVALTGAETAFDRSRPGGEPAWLQYFDGAYLSAKTGRALLDASDAPRSADAMRLSLDMKGGFERGHVFNLALLAGALLDSGRVDEGCAIALHAIESADGIASERVNGELAAVAGRLERYGDFAPAREALAALPTARRGGRGRRATR